MMLRFFLSALLWALMASASAEIYKWVDSTGTHYSDKPPRVDAELLDIESRRTDPERIAGLKNPPGDNNEVGVVVTDDEAERDRIAAEQAAQRALNCERARKALNSLLSATRIYEPLPDGERRYLDEAEVEQRKASAQADVDKWCNSTS